MSDLHAGFQRADADARGDGLFAFLERVDGLPHVQAIKRPTLLEITGPLFLSSPVVSNVQYRLKEVDGGTLIMFRHSAFGFVPDDYREGLAKGWTALGERVRRRAETRRITH